MQSRGVIMGRQCVHIGTCDGAEQTARSISKMTAREMGDTECKSGYARLILTTCGSEMTNEQIM